jgi:hypothetical protein
MIANVRRSVSERYGEERLCWCCSIDRLTGAAGSMRETSELKSQHHPAGLALVGGGRSVHFSWAVFLGRRCPTGVKRACLAPSVALR